MYMVCSYKLCSYFYQETVGNFFKFWWGTAFRHLSFSQAKQVSILCPHLPSSLITLTVVSSYRPNTRSEVTVTSSLPSETRSFQRKRVNDLPAESHAVKRARAPYCYNRQIQTSSSRSTTISRPRMVIPEIEYGCLNVIWQSGKPFRFLRLDWTIAGANTFIGAIEKYRTLCTWFDTYFTATIVI